MSQHPGEIAVQRRTGVDRENWGTSGVRPEIPPVAAEFLEQQRILAVGAADASGAVWADAIAGPAGFVSALDDRTVMVAGLPRLLAPQFGTEHDVGLLAIEPGTRRRMRVNGTAHRRGEGLLVRTEQVYANCPKYIQTREVIEDAPRHVPGAPRTSAELTPAQRERIKRADTFFIATHAPGLGTDVSHRGGNPGFVVVAGPGRLAWPDYVGNAMYMTLGNLELNPAAGLVFIDWEGGTTLHVTGQAGIDWDPARAATLSGARQVVDFEVDQVVEIPGALALSWKFGEYHRFNPGPVMKA